MTQEPARTSPAPTSRRTAGSPAVTTTTSRVAAARWAHGLVAVVALTGVVMELVTALVDGPGESGTMLERLVRLFSYFTILSNVAVGAVSVLLTLDPRRDGPVLRVAHLDALVCIAVTGIVYNTVLRGLQDLSAAGQVSNLLLHVASPLLAVVVWLVVGPRPRVDVATVLWSLAAPLAWIAWTFVRGAVVHWYPYPFLDVDEIGLGPALLGTAVVAVVFLVLAFVVRWVDGRLRPAP